MIAEIIFLKRVFKEDINTIEKDFLKLFSSKKIVVDGWAFNITGIKIRNHDSSNEFKKIEDIKFNADITFTNEGNYYGNFQLKKKLNKTFKKIGFSFSERGMQKEKSTNMEIVYKTKNNEWVWK